MPEGPEIHQAAFFINQCAQKYQFGGAIVKSAVSTKNPDIEWTAKIYNLRAEARGKELKVHLTDASDVSRGTSILFRFGMSGCFQGQSY
jgi:endonuclease VIII-like 1